MGFPWTDNAANTSTHIRTIHITELRSAVDQLRTACGLPTYSWTDNPIGLSTHVRVIHFTELHDAIQDVWTCHNMGSVPNWSVGSAPSLNRQISARDINDLRNWVDQVDPPGALNGLHWHSPVTLDPTDTRTQFNFGAGFGSTLILSHPDVPPAGESNSESDIYWLETNRTCVAGGAPFFEVVIARLLYLADKNLPDAPTLAGLWGNFVRWCQGVYNLVVLIELDLENPGPTYNPPLWNPTNPAYMIQLATSLREQGTPGEPIWLGFPGPGVGGNGAYGKPGWNTYWSDYAGVITSQFNNIAFHAYGSDLASLKDSAYNPSVDLRNRFLQLPQRITEYGIPITSYGGDHLQRVCDYASFLNWLRSGWNNYILACHAFISAPPDG
ncbi:MAG TPA: hypothetical protein VMW65_05115 [Chloroflexota bacterium]|nr:hypothetical protein [Chloroflexota bacterium]